MTGFREVLAETGIDCLKILPFLFLCYLLIELFERKAGEKSADIMVKAHKLGPVIGPFLGVIPQCGFSAIASEFYVHRVITLGTLIAIYLSTSDEMLPVLIAGGADAGTILKILGIKVIFALAAGCIIDIVMRNKQVITGGHCNVHDEDKGSFILDVIKHTLEVAVFIFLITLAVNVLIFFTGAENMSGTVLSKPVIGEILCALIGLIPNCAGSVILTQFFLKGMIGLGPLIAGLLTGAGIGPLMLIRTNSNQKENIRIIGLLSVIGIAVGILLTVFKI